jgi:hypothetical protein
VVLCLFFFDQERELLCLAQARRAERRPGPGEGRAGDVLGVPPERVSAAQRGEHVVHVSSLASLLSSSLSTFRGAWTGFARRRLGDRLFRGCDGLLLFL